MDAIRQRKSDWPLAAVCIGLSGFGLSAVPFVGTRYGDWPEAIALGIGLLPLIYLAVFAAMRFNSRIAAVENRLHELDSTKR
jgi:hypothetical protein